MKAGLAVQIAVLHHLAALGRPLRGTLVTHFAAGEECGEPGTMSLLQEGFGGHFGITTEPTELNVAVAARGLCHFRIEISGRSIHASRAHLGANPLPVLRDVLQVVQDYDREAAVMEHPLLPGGSCEPTVVRAGVKENTIPEVCELYVDRRLLPGESVETELAALDGRLEICRGGEVTVKVSMSDTSHPFEPAEIPATSQFAADVAAAAERVTGQRRELCGTPYSSDVRNLINDAGIEAVTFGPGNVAECHCADERVAIDQLRDAARVIAEVARTLLL
jgi:succinyl-diaminopimelate desuccinylase